MDNILVSIVLPTFEQSTLLHKAVESVLLQTHKNFELIVIDDNHKVAYIEQNKSYFLKLNDKRVKYFQNSKNIGARESRNKGILYSEGEYITFLDDDDIYLQDKIKNQINGMITSGAFYSVCNFSLINESGKIIDLRTRRYLKNNESLLIKHLKYHITGTSTMMFESNFLKSIGCFSIDTLFGDLGDEFFLMLKAIKNSSKIGHIDSVDVIAKVHSITGLSNFKNMITKEKKLFRFKYSLKDNLSNKDLKYIKMRHFLVSSYAYKKGGDLIKFLAYCVIAFILHPNGFIKIIIGKDR